MKPMKKRWNLLAAHKETVQELVRQLHISPLLAQVLVNRGIYTLEDARDFLGDGLPAVRDPFLMKGMKKAVERLSKALDKGERIVIYGDYDVDGITSTSILYHVLCDLGGHPEFYIPERQSEGYGLNEEAMHQLAARGVDVLITVDCGIASHDLVDEFSGAMDIIVTDHHEPPAQIPVGYAVLNPKQPGCPYPCKNLAGAGVAYKLAQALWQYRCHDELPGYTELAALGTIADLVPLTEENRWLAKVGLKAMQDGANLGLQALIAAAGLTPEQVTAGRIAFTIAPRLNASGRISHATKGVQLLISENPQEAQVLAQELSLLNQERQDIERAIGEAAVDQIRRNHHEGDGVLIAAGQDWHVGVIGIAASRLVETYYKPSLVIGIHDGVGKGSCRSIAGFNMYDALTSASDLLLQYGGHPMAAGFSIAPEHIEALRLRLNEYAAAHMKAEDYIPVVPVDAVVSLQDVTLPVIDELSRLEPYGMGNSRPVFAVRDVTVREIYPMGREKQHLRVALRGADGTTRSGVGWSMADLCANIVVGDHVDAAVQVERNDFNGQSSPQLVLQDISYTEPTIQLDRQTMVAVYRVLRQRAPVPGRPVWQVQQSLQAALGDVYDGHTLLAAVQVLLELGVLGRNELPTGPVYYVPEVHEKMCLTASPTYRQCSQA